MLRLAREALLRLGASSVPFPPQQAQAQAQALRLLLLRPVSSSSKKAHSFTVSYLINSCGLSPESALSASKIVQFANPSRPDAVLEVFRNRGLSRTQISCVFRRYPKMLVSSPDILLTKLDFLHSRGISDQELVKLVVALPAVLTRSLDNHLIPTFEYISGLLQSDAKAQTCIKKNPKILYSDPKTLLVPSIAILRGCGVPEVKIRRLVQFQPGTLLTSEVRFNEAVSRVKAMGFDPSRTNFILALQVIRGMNKSKWRSKVDAFGKWGWSEDDIVFAFRRNPWCMSMSESKITGVMDIFVNEMGLDPLYMARHPTMMMMSLQKRIVPWCLVFRVLLSKGLIRTTRSLSGFLGVSEKLFLEKILTANLGEAPELLDLYNEKIGLANLGTL
ncbi:uncharacterized protein LOC115751789 [Rhodamnia argentea]|uniref:Uncharacterized protein LOC115751789 n=1 Tax=Rhodamnia argentea TaxID=178133 RepID=A0ABM3HZ33_9MYRT|nr:uncharacterized protein LOC115751789 [Rhodamnia argentea]